MSAHPSPPVPSPARLRGTWTLGFETRLFSAALMQPIATPLMTTGPASQPLTCWLGAGPQTPGAHVRVPSCSLLCPDLSL